MGETSISQIVLYAVALAMGVVSIITLALVEAFDVKTIGLLLGIGMICLGIAGLESVDRD